MKTNTNNNIAASIALLSRYNWFTINTKTAEGKENVFHATEVKTELAVFLKFERQFANPIYSDNVITGIAAAEDMVTYLTASGTTYTVKGQHNASIADQQTANGSLDNPASLIDWSRSQIDEAGNVLVVLDFNKAKDLNRQSRAMIKRFINADLGGLRNSRQTCRTIYLEALADGNNTVNVGMFDLERNEKTTAKIYCADYMDIVWSVEDQATAQKIYQFMNEAKEQLEAVIPLF